MALFWRRSKKKRGQPVGAPRSERKKRRVFGRASIAQTASPYSGTQNLLSGKIRKAKRRHVASGGGRLAAPPSRLRPQKTSRLKKILLALLPLCAGGGLVYFIFFTEYFLINEFHVYEEGTEISSNLELNELVRQHLNGQNILFFDDSTMRGDILKNHPEYSTAAISKKLPDTIEVTLEKFPVTANIIDIIEGADGLRVQKKYLVNSRGMIIMENEEIPDLPYIRISTSQALGLNAYPLDRQKLEYITGLVKVFEEKFGLRVVEAVYLKAAREVHLRTEKDFDVWFDLGKDMLLQIDKLKRALPKLDIYNTPLHYIDLRISGNNAEKVIFKRR
jgi:hypothetical protein